MGYAKHVGRIGALAVALGVGYGVTPTVAFADTADNAGSEGASASSATSAGPARQARPSRGGTERGKPAQSSSDTAPAARPAPDVDAVADPEPEPVNQRGSDSVPAGHSSVPTAANNSAAPVSRNAEPALAAADPAPSPNTPAVGAASAQGDRVAAPAASVVAAAAVSTPVAAAQPASPAPARPLPAASTARLVSAALAPLLAGGTGGAPAQAPLLFSVLAWARKEFERATGITLPAAVTTTGQPQSPNLLVNPGAEFGDPSLSGMTSVSVPGWTATGTPTVIKYDTPRTMWSVGMPFPFPNLPSIWSFPHADKGATDGGAQFFGGGMVADSSISQTVDLSAAASTIDAGNVSYDLGAWLGGYSLDPSQASVKVTFLDADNHELGTGKIGPVTLWDRLGDINLLQRSTTGTLPVGTRSAKVEVAFDDMNPIKYGFNADYNDAFADNISFTIGAPLPAPSAPQPIASTPPQLDHVFMVYVENKGYTNIVDSPNAPYLNELIKTYGFADNYYALTHGSLPNYYPIVGATNYGITYNCDEPCIDVAKEDTIPGRLDLAGKSWKSYALGLVPGEDPLVGTDVYTTDQTAFPAFKWIAEDPAYAKSHIVPLEQMAVDLQSKETTPNYVWYAADSQYNGEGPVSGISGALKFVLNQFDPDHQYNVPALDEFLNQTVPVIMSSPVWNDPNEKSVLVITFDEDNMNTSLGFGNEGNHVVTVVISSPGAITAGMKGGSFTATTQYDHYSLVRFIEDSLGVAPINNNDKYAVPMNEFWNGTGSTSGSSKV